MPHTPDRRRIAARRAITGEPLTLARRGLPPRGQLIDVPAAQQVLQSVLLQCFAYPHPVHPWDPERGRHLPSLFALYGGWVSPRAGRIVFGATAAARVCSYLLPFVLPGDWAARCAGIPGLRFDRPTSRGFALRHLPTGIGLEIQDGHRGSVRTLTRELAWNRDVEDERGFQPAWTQSVLTDIEQRWAHNWQPTDHTTLTSALFMGMRALEYDGSRWGASACHLTFVPASSTDGIPTVEWCDGVAPARATATLHALGLGADGQPFTAQHLTTDQLLLRAGRHPIELRRRTACPHCNRSPAFQPASVQPPPAR